MPTKKITTPGSLRAQLETLEHELVSQALRATRGDVRAAADLLDTPERTLWRRMRERLHITPADYRIHPPGD